MDPVHHLHHRISRLQPRPFTRSGLDLQLAPQHIGERRYRMAVHGRFFPARQTQPNRRDLWLPLRVGELAPVPGTVGLQQGFRRSRADESQQH